MTADGVRLTFTIPGPIRGKQRAGRVQLANGFVRSFNPPQTVKNEQLIRQFAAVQMRGRPPFTGPMRLTIHAYMIMPKSWSRKRKENAHYVTGKPDVDNVVKLVADALNKIAWNDDSQIAELIFSRVFATEERTHIEIVPLDGV